ncbi:class I SAM-dependent methyltransferase [Pseudonocardia lacus]|uniref:class I SAM-dependent methyltransferase n=1 Tax=Pseudonocardia lacus TaxID=2835865 RepID=UPI001BDDA018|nr:class I SAM-dependent methyltransferase [Pseudonocardia lacus]
MPDALFEHPRLVALYDVLNGVDRPDLDAYTAIADELGARRVLDIGCGTGALAVALAAGGREVTGVDPAAGSVAYARRRPGAERVRWIHGDAGAVPDLAADLAVMTGNVAQAIVEPADWAVALDGAHRALRPGGHLVFETRDPAFRGWEEWTGPRTHRSVDVPGVGVVETRTELTAVELPLVSFRATYVFASDGQVLTSDSTLRFRGRDEVEADLAEHGFAVDEVRDAPDRPAREFVFLTRRTP